MLYLLNDSFMFTIASLYRPTIPTRSKYIWPGSFLNHNSLKEYIGRYLIQYYYITLLLFLQYFRGLWDPRPGSYGRIM